MTYVNTSDEELEKLIQWVESAEEASYDARQLSERDRDYYDNIQWTDEEIQELKERGQPPVTVNRIKRKIDFLEGTERNQRTDPKAYPRNADDEDAARAATDGIRYVCEKERYDVLRSNVWKNLMIEGMGAVMVHVEDRNEQPEIVLKDIPWDRLGYDPASMRADFSDAKYKYMVVWMDYEDAVEMFPDRKDVLEITLNSATESDTYDDKPKWTIWADGKRKRVRLIEMHYRKPDGEWYWCIFTWGGKLADGMSPYVNEYGETECPIVMTSSYVDRDNNRYGVVREMIGPQDEINKRRSKALHLLTVNQVIADEGAVQDVENAKTELAKPDGWISKHAGMELQIDRNVEMATAQFQLLQEAKGEIDLMGPNASMMGKSDRAESGRAIIAQQQGGLVEMGPLLDRLRQFNYAVYRLIWNRIRQYWTEERWVRVTDDERNLRFVGFNRPVTLGEQLMKQQGASDEDIQARMQEIQAHPRFSQIVGQDNVPGDIDVDILIEEGPDSVTIQIEQFEILSQMVSAGVPIPMDMLIEAAPSLRNKDAILERIRGTEEQQAQQAQQAQQQAMLEQQVAQLQMQQAQAETAAKQAQAQKDMAQAAKLQQEAQLTGREIVSEAVKDVAEAEKTKAETAILLARGEAAAAKDIAGIDKLRAETAKIIATPIPTGSEGKTNAA